MHLDPAGTSSAKVRDSPLLTRGLLHETYFMRQRRQPIKDEDRVISERSREKTMKRAGNLLAAKARSVRELRERLLEKPWTDASIVDEVIEKLKGYKYLDDEQYARETALSKLRQKPQGKRRLQQSMARKKLDRSTVDTAISDAFEAMPESDLIDLAIAKRLKLKGFPDTRDETKKFYDFLLRQGFGFDLIREKMSAVDKNRYSENETEDIPS
ncbi:MAG: RecX family transcriptional regulator [Pyrinomonadaceae bacterium]